MKPHKSTSPLPWGGRCSPTDVLAQLQTHNRLHLDLELDGLAVASLGRPTVSAALAARFGGIEEEESAKKKQQEVLNTVKINRKKTNKSKATPEPPLGAQEYAALPAELCTAASSPGVGAGAVSAPYPLALALHAPKSPSRDLPAASWSIVFMGKSEVCVKNRPSDEGLPVPAQNVSPPCARMLPLQYPSCSSGCKSKTATPAGNWCKPPPFPTYSGFPATSRLPQ